MVGENMKENIRDAIMTLWMLPALVCLYWAGVMARESIWGWGWFLIIGAILTFFALGSMNYHRE